MSTPITVDDLVLDEHCDCCDGKRYCYGCSEPWERFEVRCKKCHGTGRMPTELGQYVLNFVRWHQENEG